VDASAFRDARPAGFWIRAAAAVADFVVFGLVQLSFGFAGARLWGRTVEESPLFQVLVVAFTVIFTGLYTTLLHALTGQTLGKLVFGVRVVGVGGDPLGVGPALLRYLAYYASLLPLATGFLMAALRTDKRALHDLVAGSRAVRQPAARRRVIADVAADATPTDAG
jgi:uncharacterized RDD family membrane protein YckC